MISDHDLDEWEIWLEYPQYHKWWNKLYLSQVMGYSCGPCGTKIPETAEYVIRPIYNLAGMGIGTEIKVLKKGDLSSVPPGYFWCEYFKGRHFSATYAKREKWKCIHNWQGWNDKSNVVKFTKWVRCENLNEMPKQFEDIDVPYMNIEFIENNPIEIHFRPSGNPDGTYDSKWNEYIPIWDNKTKEEFKNKGYTWIDNPFKDWMEDKKHFMKEERLGYYVR